MSKIQAILAKATECVPKRGETIHDEAYRKRLVLAVGELSDDDWNALPAEAQDYVNESSDALNAKKDTLPWPDAEKADEPAARTRRRAAAEDDQPAAQVEAYKPEKGHEVKVVTTRDKVYEGKVIDPDDKGELVLEVGKDEVGIDLERIKSITRTDKPAAEPEPTTRRRRAADEDDQPAAPKDPGVGDTVEVITAREKTHVGNVVEISGEVLVIKTAAGEELEFDPAKLKSVKVKVDNSSKAEPSTSGKADDVKARKTTKDDNDGVSVTTRARELMCDNMGASVDDISKMLTKEGLTFKENTIKLIYGDVHKLFKMLRERKLLK